MVSNAIKALIIIACITTGIVAVLFAPLQVTQYQGTRSVQNSGSVEQINLITDSDVANIQISYATHSDADLINLTYFYIVRHAIVFPAPNMTVSFINSTSGNILTVKLTIDTKALGFISVGYTMVHLTINPKLLSNLSIHVNSGNINLDNTYSSNKTFVDINLRTASGNINVNLVNQSHVRDNLYLRTSSGNINMDLEANAYIGGSLQANTTSGNIGVQLKAGVTLDDDFGLRTASGNINLIFSNISLDNNVVAGTLQVISGNIGIWVQQLTDLSGNLTLTANTLSGNVNLHIDLEADDISSLISPTKVSGNLNYFPDPPLGFHHSPTPLSASVISDILRNSNINATLVTISGNINIFASST